MDGMTFLKHLVQDNRVPVGVIAATGFPTPAGEQEFRKTGSPNVIPLDYVSKPFELTAMLDSVSRSLDRIHTQREAAAAT